MVRVGFVVENSTLAGQDIVLCLPKELYWYGGPTNEILSRLFFLWKVLGLIFWQSATLQQSIFGKIVNFNQIETEYNLDDIHTLS